MRHFLLVGLIIFTSGVADAESTLDSLDAFQWNHRIILIKSPENCSDVTSMLNKEQSSISERDILWFVLCDNGVKTNSSGAFSELFYSNTNSQYFNEIKLGTILIGKDGSIKRRSKELLLPSLFDLIDSMPMRRSEMRNR